MPRQSLIVLRSGTSSQWSTADPVLAAGEPGYDLDTRSLRIGDGSSTWSTLTPPAVDAASDVVQPSDQGWVGWSFDPTSADNNFGTALGVSYVARIPTRTRTPISGLILPIVTVATTPTAGQCWGGVFGSDGTLLGKGELTGLTTVGVAVASWTTVIPSEDWLFARWVVNGAVAPGVLRGTGSSSAFTTIANYPLSAAQSRFASLGSGLTDLASFDPSTLTQIQPFCVGVS